MLREEIDCLFEAIGKLDSELSIMKSFESELSDIGRKQGISVDTIVRLVKENEKILAKQKVTVTRIIRFMSCSIVC